mgnify:CR=1 FL=1
MARGKGEGSLYKQADGLWAASVTLPPGPGNKRRRKVIRSKNKAVVQKKLQDLKADLRKNGDLPTSGITVEKWMAHWLDEIAVRDIRPKTLAGYRSTTTNYIVPLLGRKPLGKLSANDVRQMEKWIRSTPKSMKLRALPPEEWPDDTPMLSGDTALLAHTALSVALTAAVAEGYATSNVCEVAGRPSKAKTQQHALTPEEAITLLAYVAARPDAALWTTYILTGARRGEILGLEADRVSDTLDLSWQLQRIKDIESVPESFEHRHLTGTMYLTRPKSSAGLRVLPLVEPLRSVLALHMQTVKSGLVFLNPDGRPWDPDTASKTWKKILAEAGLPSNITLHGARHTVVDLLFDAGVSDSTIMQIVGHSSRAMTRQYQTRVNQELAKQAMEQMSSSLVSK